MESEKEEEKTMQNIKKDGENKDFYDRMAKSVCKYFKEKIPKTGKPTSANKEWTTLAAILQSSKESDNCSSSGDVNPEFKVVAIGTGTKCLGQNELSPLGDVLSDSHAEIVCRRAFLLYLYDQLFLTMSNETKTRTIFEDIKFEENSSSSASEQNCKQFMLRPEIKFHLFVSHIPCGDAAIFDISSNKILIENDKPKLEETQENTTSNECPIEIKKPKIDEDSPTSSSFTTTTTTANTDTTKTTTTTNNNNNATLVGHRTGAKLHVQDAVYEDIQTIGKCRLKPGKGDPTISMSCSDKIAKWQIMGIQGSLLGNFIKKPIFFESVIIGKLDHFDPVSIKRAIYDRFHVDLKSVLDKCLPNNGMWWLKEEKKENLQQQNIFIIPSIYQSSINFMDFPKDGEGRPAPASISGYFKTSTNKFQIDVSVNGRKQGANKKAFGKPLSQVQICRRKIFVQFIKACKKYEETFKQPLIPSNVFSIDTTTSSSSNEDDDQLSMTYFEAKKLNSLYYETWNALKTNMMNGWTTKPKHLSLFSLTSKDFV